MATKTGILVVYLVGGLFLSASAPAAPLPACTISMDAVCPDVVGGQCGATFSSALGDTCTSIGVLNCYSSGLNSYRVTTAAPLIITFSDDATSLSVFFSHELAGQSGEMRFFDAVVGGSEVDPPLMTNGACSGPMPALQSFSFSAAVRRIEVTALSGTLWIDDFGVNTISVCGDGVLDAGETCDDGFTDACGSCNATCTATGAGSVCGDGDICPETEQCDDMNMVPGDGCSATCTDDTAIPTVSAWGMIAMLGLTLVAGTLLFRSGRRLTV